MERHPFIFQPGQWIGEGKVTFSLSSEKLHFFTKWIVKDRFKEEIECEQIVEMQGADEHVFNHFVLSDIQKSTFHIILENDLIGKVLGVGIIDSKTIGWEFRGENGLEGFETFTLQGNEYLVHAEYASQDQFRSIIDGRIWKKQI